MALIISLLSFLSVFRSCNTISLLAMCLLSGFLGFRDRGISGLSADSHANFPTIHGLPRSGTQKPISFPALHNIRKTGFLYGIGQAATVIALFSRRPFHTPIISHRQNASLDSNFLGL